MVPKKIPKKTRKKERKKRNAKKEEGRVSYIEKLWNHAKGRWPGLCYAISQPADTKHVKVNDFFALLLVRTRCDKRATKTLQNDNNISNLKFMNELQYDFERTEK